MMALMMTCTDMHMQWQHFGEAASKDTATVALLKKLISVEAPDLVVYTGDM